MSKRSTSNSGNVDFKRLGTDFLNYSDRHPKGNTSFQLQESNFEFSFKFNAKTPHANIQLKAWIHTAISIIQYERY